MSRPTQYWPLLVALLGVAGLVYGGWNLVQRPGAAPDPDDDAYVEEDDFTQVTPERGEQWAVVESREEPELLEFTGRVRAFAETPVRAPQGMRVPVEKIHHEQGDWVEEGDPLISFHRDAIVKAIDEARLEGRTADLERFEGYLASDPLRAPKSGRVGTIWAELGNVPYDEGIPLVTLIADDGFALDVAVPKDVVVRHVPLGLEVEARIETIAELVHGVVSGHDATGPDQPAEFVEGDSTRVTVALDSVDGVEVDMIGTVRLPHGTKEVPLLPKAAVEWRGDVPVVRAFEDGEILERTVRIARDERGWRVEGEFYVVEYGVFVGQGVVVPASQ